MTFDSRQSIAHSGGWLVDFHVHLHDRFDVDEFLDGSLRNFANAGAEIGAGRAAGCLFLTDTRRQRGFLRLQENTGVWSAEDTAEHTSLILSRQGSSAVLAVVAGRQVVTRERLEVLVLGSTAEIPDGNPIGQTLDAVGDKQLVVLPWGFGKWTFSRGRIVEPLLGSSRRPNVFAGDNGNRPAGMPVPRLLRRAMERGVTNLPGSDPLPLRSHVHRAGSCGVFLECTPDFERPAQQILDLVRAACIQPPVFRQPQSLIDFAVSQAMLRMARRGAVRSLSETPA